MPLIAVHRDGLFSINKVAMILCRLLTEFAPVLLRLYPDNAALHAAVASAIAACGVLRQEIAKQQQPGV